MYNSDDQARHLLEAILPGFVGGRYCITFRDNDGDIRSLFPDNLDDALSMVAKNSANYHSYFSPVRYSDMRRLKSNVVDQVTVAWADLDACDPNLCEPRPSIAVETSPNRYQAFWLLDEPVSANRAEDLNRRIAYHYRAQGADVSGWTSNKLLRVPGTPNLKPHYDPPPTVTMLWSEDTRYAASDFDRLEIPPHRIRRGSSVLPPQEPVNDEWRDKVERFVGFINQRIEEGYFVKGRESAPGEGDRSFSGARYNLLSSYLEIGLPPSMFLAAVEDCDAFERDETFDYDLSAALGKHDHAELSCEQSGCPNARQPDTKLKEEPTDESVSALEARLLTSDGLDDIPDPVPLVDGFLFNDTINSLISKPGHGKSFLAISLAGAVGTGRPWYGREVKQGLVIYVVAEGVGGFKKRVRAWEKTTGKKMENVLFYPMPIQAKSPEWKDLVALCAKLKPALVILDTQARVTVGLEENSSKDMGFYVQQLDAVRQSCDACVLSVHHKGRSGDNGRGSSAIDGAVNTELRAEKEKTDDGSVLVTLSNAKQKDEAEADDLVFEFMQVDLGHDKNGRPINSAILKLTTGTEDASAQSEQTILFVLQTFFTQGGTKGEVKELAKLPRSSFYRAWDKLLASGAIRKEGTKFVAGEGFTTNWERF